MASYNVYATGGGYYNHSLSSYGYQDATHHFYAGLSSAGQRFHSRILFPIKLGDGRPITITSAKMRLFRNDGASSTGNITSYITTRGDSNLAQNLKITADSGSKTWTFNANQRQALVARNNATATIYIDHASTARVRFTGYDNGSYAQSKHPYLMITWNYVQSTGSVTSNYYDQPATLKINSAHSNYTHKVSWILPNSTVYHTQSLAAGVASASCTFYGANSTKAGDPADNYGNFFGTGYTATFKVTLDTYDSSNTLVGSNSYNVVLNKPSSFSLGGIEDCEYNQTAVLQFIPAYTSYYHEVSWYIRNSNVALHTETIASTGNTDMIQTGYSYFIGTSLNVNDYFTNYSNTCPAVVVLKTYSTDGTLQGQQSLTFNLIKEPDESRLLVDLHPNPIIMDSSIIVRNPVLNNNIPLRDLFSEISKYTLDKLRPIGTIYISTESTNPSTLFGGTWNTYAPARTLYTTNTASNVGNTGGSFTHTLTLAQLPSHTHQLTYYSTNKKHLLYKGSGTTSRGGSSSAENYCGNTGGGASHNNTQPYTATYMWVRTK